MNSKPSPTQGWCGFGRRVVSGGPRRGGDVRCPNRTPDGRVYCAEHLAQAMARLPDRAIGDVRGLRYPSAQVLYNLARW